MSRFDDEILTEAAAWHAASDGDDMDWDGFTIWLEADPRHRLAYDEIALADSLVADHRDVLGAPQAPAQDEVDNVVRPTFFGWKRWAGMAIAATVAALLIVPNYFGSSPEVYETGNASRQVALNDGSSVILAPHSRLTVEGRAQERLALSGGGWFDIVHDETRPLTITAGQLQIRDIGTQFDVQSDNDSVRVEVADGKVEVSSGLLSQPLRMEAGRGLLFDGKAGTAIVSPVPAQDAGEWRSGRLSYNTTPLPLVADDLARYAGVSIEVPEQLRNRRFSGTLVIGDGEAAVRDLAQVMGLALVPDAGGYRLAERNR